MNRLIKLTATILAAATFSSPSLAGECGLEETTTPAKLARYAYEHNPSVTAAKSEWLAAAERYRARTRYPDPQLMVTYFPEPIETRLGPQDWNMTLSQMVPFPGELGSEGDVIEAMAGVQRVKLDKTVNTLGAAVKGSAHELWYIRRAIEAAAEQAALIEQLSTVAETSYAAGGAGKTQLVDVVKAQSQAAQVRYDGLLLEELEFTETARLNTLLNRNPTAEIGRIEVGAVTPLAQGLDELVELAVTKRDEIKLAQAKVKVAEASLDKARFTNYPDFKLGLFYAGIGTPDVATQPKDAGRDAVGVQFAMSLPLWWGKNSGKIEAAGASHTAARANKRAVTNRTKGLVHTLYFKLNNARRLITLYRDELLPQAARAVGNAEVWHREGLGAFSDFIEAQAALYNFRLSLARARADYGKTLAKMESVVGVVLGGAAAGEVQK